MARDQINDAVAVVKSGRLTRRFHCYHMNAPQRVDAHSWGVAMFVYILTRGEPSINLLMAALTHDLAEFRTGDIPSPIKRRLEIGDKVARLEAAVLAPANLSFETRLGGREPRILALADIADALATLYEEQGTGNRSLDGVLETYLDYLSTGFDLSPWEEEVFAAIKSNWPAPQLYAKTGETT